VPGSPGAVRQARPAPAPALLGCKHGSFGAPEAISMHAEDLLAVASAVAKPCMCMWVGPSAQGLLRAAGAVCARAGLGQKAPCTGCGRGSPTLHASMAACQPPPGVAACTGPATALVTSALGPVSGRAGAPPQVHERVAHRAEPRVLQRAAGRLRACQAAAVGEGASPARPVRHALHVCQMNRPGSCTVARPGRHGQHGALLFCSRMPCFVAGTGLQLAACGACACRLSLVYVPGARLPHDRVQTLHRPSRHGRTGAVLVCAYMGCNKQALVCCGHTTHNIPVPVRSPKSNWVGPHQYCVEESRGNPRCCSVFAHYFFLACACVPSHGQVECMLKGIFVWHLRVCHLWPHAQPSVAACCACCACWNMCWRAHAAMQVAGLKLQITGHSQRCRADTYWSYFPLNCPALPCMQTRPRRH